MELLRRRAENVLSKHTACWWTALDVVGDDDAPVAHVHHLVILHDEFVMMDVFLEYFAVSAPVLAPASFSSDMDDDLYDEFGNYIGPDADSDDDGAVNDVEDRPDTPMVSHSS